MCLNLYIPFEKSFHLSFKFSNSWIQFANQVRETQIVIFVVSFTLNTTRLRDEMSEALLLSQELSCVSPSALFVYFLDLTSFL